jgi:hypothetical protein
VSGQDAGQPFQLADFRIQSDIGVRQLLMQAESHSVREDGFSGQGVCQLLA